MYKYTLLTNNKKIYKQQQFEFNQNTNSSNMATRRSNTESIAIEYEDFEPNFQWKEDESSHTLVGHLPGKPSFIFMHH